MFFRKYTRNVALFLGPVIKNRAAFLIGISTFFLGLGKGIFVYSVMLLRMSIKDILSILATALIARQKFNPKSLSV